MVPPSRAVVFFVFFLPVSLAKMSSASKMARFVLCLGLKSEPELGQESLRGARTIS